MPAENSQRMTLEELQSHWLTAPRPLNTPFTAGSEFAYPIAPFGRAHYAQEDTSLNQALWSLWPVSPTDEPLEEALKTAEAKRDE